MQRIRIKYSKAISGDDRVRFIGHLDMIRLWERAIRRTEIPVAYTEGFNPRQKLSFGPPLPLGFLSECEFLDIHLERWTNPGLVKEELNKVLPPGIVIISADNVFSGLASLSAQIKTAEYTAAAAQHVVPRMNEILDSKQLIVKRKDKDFDIRPKIKGLSYSDGKLTITAQCDNYGALKGTEIMGLFKDTPLSSVTRTRLY